MLSLRSFLLVLFLIDYLSIFGLYNLNRLDDYGFYISEIVCLGLVLIARNKSLRTPEILLLIFLTFYLLKGVVDYGLTAGLLVETKPFFYLVALIFYKDSLKNILLFKLLKGVLILKALIVIFGSKILIGVIDLPIRDNFIFGPVLNFPYPLSDLVLILLGISFKRGVYILLGLGSLLFTPHSYILLVGLLLILLGTRSLRYVLIVIVPMLVFEFWYLGKGALESRLIVYARKFQLISDSPFLGLGFVPKDSSLATEYAHTAITRYDLTINTIDSGYLDLILRFGIVGGLVYLLLVTQILRKRLTGPPLVLAVILLYSQLTWTISTSYLGLAFLFLLSQMPFINGNLHSAQNQHIQ